MTGPIESFILTEGYHDCAFWDGCLLYFKCTDASLKPDGRRIPRPYDPFGDPIGFGHHAFISKSGSFIRVVPAMGKKNVPQHLRSRLKRCAVKPLQRLVVNVDCDEHADGSKSPVTMLTVDAVQAIVNEVDPSGTKTADVEFKMFAGETTVSLVAWKAPDPAGDGIPNQQSLERIMCAALLAVYPKRGPAVHEWLKSRPDAPYAGPKEFAWSYLAGWHADVGSYEGFCSSIWNKPDIVEKLRPRLEACGAWRVADALST